MGVTHGFSIHDDGGGRLELRHGAVARRLCGLLVLVLAWAALDLALSPTIRTSAGPNVSPWITMPVGLLAAGAGLALLLYRSGMTFDRARGEVRRWSGFPRPTRVQRHPLPEFRSVSVRREVRTVHTERGSSTRVVYPVKLNRGAGAWGPATEEKSAALTVFEGRDALTARRLAERVARACGLELHSAMTKDCVATVRQPHELDHGLRQRLAERGESPPEPSPPARTRLRVAAEGDGYAVELPPVGILRGGLGIALLALPGMFLFGGFALAFLKDAPAALLVFMWGVASLPLVIGLGFGLARGLRRERLRVGPAELALSTRGLFGTRTVALSADEVEELAWSGSARALLGGLVASGGVTAVTDARLLEFARGADDADRRYLAALIEHAFCRTSPPAPQRVTAQV